MKKEDILRIIAENEAVERELFSTKEGQKLLELGFKKKNLCVAMLRKLTEDENRFDTFAKRLEQALSEELTTQTELKLMPRQSGRDVLALYYFFNHTNGMLALKNHYVSLVEIAKYNEKRIDHLLCDQGMELLKSGIPMSVCDIIMTNKITDATIIKNICSAHSEGYLSKDKIEALSNKYWASETLSTIFKNPDAIEAFKKGLFTLTEAAPIPVHRLEKLSETLFTKKGLKYFENGFTLTEAHKMQKSELEDILNPALDVSSTNTIHQRLELKPTIEITKEKQKTESILTPVQSYEPPTTPILTPGSYRSIRNFNR